MALASQQTTYTTGLTVTDVILNNEFGEIYTNLNSITNDQINASAGIETSKLELATESADAIVLANDVALTLNPDSGTASTLKQRAGDDVVLKIGTAAASFIVEDSTGTTALLVDTADEFVGSYNGYELRAYDAANTKYGRFYNDGTDTYIGSSNNDTILTAPANIRMIPNSNGGKVTIGKMPRRANSSTTYAESFIQSGFVYVEGDGTNQITAVVTFPIAFSSDLVRVVASPGSQFGSAGDEGSGTTTGRSAARSYDIRATQTGLSLNTLTSTDTFAAGTWYPIHWIAIGPL